MDTASGRLIAFSNIEAQHEGCYNMPNLENDTDLIGKKFENGAWVESSTPYAAPFAIILGRNNA